MPPAWRASAIGHEDLEDPRQIAVLALRLPDKRTPDAGRFVLRNGLDAGHNALLTPSGHHASVAPQRRANAMALA